MPPGPEPDTPAAIDFLNWWRPDGVLTLSTIATHGSIETRSWEVSEASPAWDEIAVWIDRWQGRRNIYFIVNEARLIPSKPKKEDIVAVHAAFTDADPDAGTGYEASRQRLLGEVATLADGDLPASAVIDSGHGLNVLWRLDPPMTDVAAFEAINKPFSEAVGGKGIFNVDRLLRLPGTINLPNKAKLAKGYPAEPTLARLLHRSETRYTPRQIEDFTVARARRVAVVHDVPAKPPAPLRTRGHASDSPSISLKFLALPDWLQAKVTQPTPAGQRSEAIFKVVANLVERGWTNADIETLFAQHPGGIGEKHATRSKLAADIERIRQKAGHADPATDFAGSTSNRPTVELRSGALHLIATEAEEALIAGGAPFYVRGGEIVKPVVEEVDAAHGALTKVARLRAIDQDAMLDWLSRCAVWMKFDARKARLVVADPTVAIARTVLAREGEWRLPHIVGVITTPTLRPDGSILRIEGYDAATRLVLVDPPPMPPIPERPSRADALQALELLDELLVDFPFVDDASRSVALSALITPVVRGALKVAPLHVARAPTPGSGKSYLIDLAAAIAIGRTCPVVAAGRTEEETEKRLGAALLAGQPIVSIDNLNGELSGDCLCQMVERPVVQIRTLGLSKLTEIESRATVFATGNNIVLVGDMVRRVVVCSLDPDVERPELRRFTTNPLGAVLKRRGHYVAAALTVVRAYVSAGCPDPCPPLASFEDWSRLVRSPLTWLGRADPVATMEVARGEDPETQALREVVATWYEAIGPNVRLTAREMTARAEETHLLGEGDYQQLPERHLKYPALHDALVAIASDRSGINPQRLGNWLGRRKGRVIDGHKIVSLIDKHAKQTRWYLSDAP